MTVWVAADGNVPCSLNEHGEYCLDPEDRAAALLFVRRCDAERFLAAYRRGGNRVHQGLRVMEMVL